MRPYAPKLLVYAVLCYLCRAVEHLAYELTERFRRGYQLSSAVVVESEVGERSQR